MQDFQIVNKLFLQHTLSLDNLMSMASKANKYKVKWSNERIVIFITVILSTHRFIKKMLPNFTKHDWD